jgi:alanyl-tRNA synthetase
MATGQIGTFRVFRETGIAAGVRRIEALTGETAERYIDEHMDMVKQIAGSFEKQQDLVKAVKGLVSQNSQLAKQVEQFQQNMLGIIARNLESKLEKVGSYSLAVSRVEVDEPNHLRDLSFRLRSRYPRLNLILGAEINGKAHLAVMLSDLMLESHELSAQKIIKEVASHIQGGGGGQPFFATAGGKNPEGLDMALEQARKILIDELGGE